MSSAPCICSVAADLQVRLERQKVGYLHLVWHVQTTDYSLRFQVKVADYLSAPAAWDKQFVVAFAVARDRDDHGYIPAPTAHHAADCRHLSANADVTDICFYVDARKDLTRRGSYGGRDLVDSIEVQSIGGALRLLDQIVILSGKFHGP